MRTFKITNYSGKWPCSCSGDLCLIDENHKFYKFEHPLHPVGPFSMRNSHEANQTTWKFEPFYYGEKDRYNLTEAEIKQINMLVNEQDFYDKYCRPHCGGCN